MLTSKEDREKEDSVANYLIDHYDICDLLNLWEELGGIYSQDEVGVVYFLIESYGWEAILKVLSPKLIKQLTSTDPIDREDAREQMKEMGFG